MENNNKNCKSCIHCEVGEKPDIGEDRKGYCKKWKNQIPNIYAFQCSSYDFSKEFENKGLLKFERDTQELSYDFGGFRVVDKEYPNYITMELYSEGSDWFRFNYYYVKKNEDGKKSNFDILGHLSVGRMIRKNKIGKGTYVDKPYWRWELDGDVSIKQNGYIRLSADDDGYANIRLDTLKLNLAIMERVEKSGDPLDVPEGIEVQFIRSEKYNTLQE